MTVRADITLVDQDYRYCDVCGAEDNTIKVLSFRSINEKENCNHQVASLLLCSYCRHLTCNVLMMENTL